MSEGDGRGVWVVWWWCLEVGIATLKHLFRVHREKVDGFQGPQADFHAKNCIKMDDISNRQMLPPPFRKCNRLGLGGGVFSPSGFIKVSGCMCGREEKVCVVVVREEV